MKKIYMYIKGENPMKYFYRKDRRSHSGMCWFSTRLAALKHMYNDNGAFELYEQSDDPALMKLDTNSLEDMEKFYAAYVKEFGYRGSGVGKDGMGPDIIEVELDREFEDGLL